MRCSVFAESLLLRLVDRDCHIEIIRRTQGPSFRNHPINPAPATLAFDGGNEANWRQTIGRSEADVRLHGLSLKSSSLPMYMT